MQYIMSVVNLFMVSDINEFNAKLEHGCGLRRKILLNIKFLKSLGVNFENVFFFSYLELFYAQIMRSIIGILIK